MEVTLRAKEPEKIEFTATITMRLDSWIKLRESLGPVPPSVFATLYDAINLCVGQAERYFIPPPDEATRYERD